MKKVASDVGGTFTDLVFFDQKTNETGFQLTGNGSCKPMDKGNPLSNSPICRGAAPGWFFWSKNKFFACAKNLFLPLRGRRPPLCLH